MRKFIAFLIYTLSVFVMMAFMFAPVVIYSATQSVWAYLLYIPMLLANHKFLEFMKPIYRSYGDESWKRD